jgi:hypothetical protein
VARLIAEDLASSIVYTPSAKTGPRFFVPVERYRELKTWLDRVKIKYPHVLVVAGAEVLGQQGVAFGPEDDVPVDEEIVEKFGVRVPGRDPDTPVFSSPGTDGRLAPTSPGTTHQPDLSRPTGRGRPPKYPFRNMTHVGDHFLAVGATRPKMQATGCNFLTKSGLRDVVEFQYLRVERGVLVVVSKTPDGRSRYEADGVGDHDDE